MLGSHFRLLSGTGMGSSSFVGSPAGPSTTRAQEKGETARAEAAYLLEQVRVRQAGQTSRARITGREGTAQSRIFSSWVPIAVMGAAVVAGFWALSSVVREKKAPKP